MDNNPIIIQAPGTAFNPNQHVMVARRGWENPSNTTKYEQDQFVLLTPSLAGYSHIMVGPGGLFAVNSDGFTKLADGSFFGLSIDRNHIYCFEALGGRYTLWPHRGRILKLTVDEEKIVSVSVVLKGLPNGCHQIDLVGSDLYICDTHYSRLIKVNLVSRDCYAYSPWGNVNFQDYAAGYPHMNSVVGMDNLLHLMLHNGSANSDRNSQIAELCPETGKLISIRSLAGRSCHNIVFLEDKSMVICDSEAGALSDGQREIVKLGDMFTRGLSIDSESVVVGLSQFARNDTRMNLGGEIVFLDRSYREKARIVLPVTIQEIRRIDGRDLSLTNWRAGLQSDQSP